MLNKGLASTGFASHIIRLCSFVAARLLVGGTPPIPLQNASHKTKNNRKHKRIHFFSI